MIVVSKYIDIILLFEGDHQCIHKLTYCNEDKGASQACKPPVTCTTWKPPHAKEMAVLYGEPHNKTAVTYTKHRMKADGKWYLLQHMCLSFMTILCPSIFVRVLEYFINLSLLWSLFVDDFPLLVPSRVPVRVSHLYRVHCRLPETCFVIGKNRFQCH